MRRRVLVPTGQMTQLSETSAQNIARECSFMTLGTCPGLKGELSPENPLLGGPPRGVSERPPEEAHADPLSPQVHPAAASVQEVRSLQSLGAAEGPDRPLQIRLLSNV